jgi:hypothetical protein
MARNLKPTSDRILDKLKNNWFVAILIVIGVAVIGVGTVAEKAKALKDFFRTEAPAAKTPSSQDMAVPSPGAINSPRTPVLVTTTIQKSSREMPSGACDGYSTWYELCSDSQAADWQIVAENFQLRGNRSCTTGNAECRKSIDTPTKVCYEFRLQGHSEECGHSGNTGIQYSTGNLSVTWQHPG